MVTEHQSHTFWYDLALLCHHLRKTEDIAWWKTILTPSQDMQMPQGSWLARQPRATLATSITPPGCRIAPCHLVPFIAGSGPCLPNPEDQDQVPAGFSKGYKVPGRVKVALRRQHPMPHKHTTLRPSATSPFPLRENCHREGGTRIKKQ